MCMVVKDPLQVIECKQQQLMSVNVLVFLIQTTKGSTFYIGLTHFFKWLKVNLKKSVRTHSGNFLAAKMVVSPNNSSKKTRSLS